jgi:hypothetical protein
MPDDPKSFSSKPNARATSAQATDVRPVNANGNEQAFARWLRGMFAVAQEIAQFTQLRLQEDMAALSTLAACASPEQALECQRRFAARAGEQYGGEMTKLSQMMISVANQGLSLYQPQAVAQARHETPRPQRTPSRKPDWKPNTALPVGKGATTQQFTATVGDYRLEIDVTRWGEGHLRANGREIAHTSSAKDARQAFRDLRKKADQFLQTEASNALEPTGAG